MKNPEHVAELLAELRTLAENDFERHRIDVLERDLHEPPQIEVIDDNHQSFNGMLYKKHRGGYYTANVCIHRVVWTYCYGTIPPNYEIHHIDGVPANNDIKNLESLSSEEHRKKHSPAKNIEKTCVICGRPFLAKKEFARYCSRSCAHHSTTYQKVCRRCGKNFSTTNKKIEYCSKQCANRDIPNRIRTTRLCTFCGNEFVGASKFCSNICRNRYYHQNQPHEERFCVICGATFNVRIKSSRQTCSATCATKLNWQQRNSAPNIFASVRSHD